MALILLVKTLQQKSLKHNARSKNFILNLD